MEEAGILLSKFLCSPTLRMGGASEDKDEDDEEKRVTLQRLIHLSRSPTQQGLLAARNAVPPLLSLITQDPPSLLLILKLLRNLCAGEPSNQQAFLQSSGAQSVALIIDKALKACDIQTEKCVELDFVLQVSLQLLGNACGGGEALKESVWMAFFPDRFRSLVLTKGQEKIFEPLCMVLYTCSHGATHRLVDLCRGDGAHLLSCCLQAAASRGILCGGASDWIYLLLADLCLKEPLLSLLFTSLGDLSGFSTSCKESVHQTVEPLFTVEQATLLNCLLIILAEKAQAHSTMSQKEEIELPMPSASIEFLAQTLRAASCFLKKTLDVSRAHASTQMMGSPYAYLPCGVPAIDVLGYTLGIFQVLSGWEYEEGECSRHFRSCIVDELLFHGIIKLCIELLEALGPPELIYQAMQHGNVDSTADHGFKAIKSLHQVSGSNSGQAEVPSKLIRTSIPYQGYRRDLVAVVGNASYQNQAVQDEVRNLGGLSLILQQCVVDEANPFLREWGLWAVRNLVDDNVENCKEIAELQLKGSLTPVELAQMGYKVEMDSVMGRPKLVNASSVTD